MGKASHDKRHPSAASLCSRGPRRMLIAAGICLMLLGCAAPSGGGGSSFSGAYGGITGGTGGADGR